MRKLSQFRFLLAGTLVISSAVSLAPDEDRYEHLASMMPGMTSEEVEKVVADAAVRNGIGQDELLETYIQEAENSITNAKNAEADGSAGPNQDLSSVVNLGNAQRKGDIFVSPASILFVEFGHAGIYYRTNLIVEAPGLGSVSRSVGSGTRQVGSGAQKFGVSTTTANQSGAADYAYNNLRGRVYNTNFFDNRYITGGMNCSQLVWAAYSTRNIELDSNLGSGVYPYDLPPSTYTYLYQTL